MPYNKAIPTGPGNYHGVYLHTKSQRYHAKTTTKPQEHIGVYGDEESAARAWDDYMFKRKESQGPFNFLVLPKAHGRNKIRSKQRAGANTSTTESSLKAPAVAATTTDESKSNDMAVANILAGLSAPAKRSKNNAIVNRVASKGTASTTAATSSKAGRGAKASSEKGRDSRFKYGVRWHKRDKKWIARAQIDSKNTYIGSFHDEEEAARAYDKRVACLGYPLNFHDVDHAVASSTGAPTTAAPKALQNGTDAMFSKPAKGVDSKGCKSASIITEESSPEKSLPSAKKRKIGSTTSEANRSGHSTGKNDSSEGNNGVAELVWVKYSASPWWPARIAKPKPEHFELKPSDTSSGAELKFVVFYGNRPTCAWLPEKNIKPFRSSRNIYVPRCKSAPFKVALKQADAEALKQTLDTSERPRNTAEENLKSRPLPEVNGTQEPMLSTSIRTFKQVLSQPLGITTKDLSLVVTGVASNSSAHEAGIKPGDRICKVGGLAISNVSQLEAALTSFKERDLSVVTVSVDAVAVSDLSGPRSRKRMAGSTPDGDESNKNEDNTFCGENKNSEDGYQSLSSSGELIWAKHLKSPWWPAQVGKPDEGHMQLKPEGKSSIFVVFFGSRRSCAWVDEENIKYYHTGRALYASQCNTHAFFTSLEQADAVAQKQAATRPKRNQKKQKADPVVENGANHSKSEDSIGAIGVANAVEGQRVTDDTPQTPPTPKYTSELTARSQGASTPNLTSATSTETAYFSKELRTSSNTTMRAAEQSTSSTSSSSTALTSLGSTSASEGRSLSLLLSPLHRTRTSEQPLRNGRRNILTANALSLLPVGPPSSATIESLRDSDSGLRWLSAPWTGLRTRSGGGPGSV